MDTTNPEHGPRDLDDDQNRRLIPDAVEDPPMNLKQGYLHIHAVDGDFDVGRTNLNVTRKPGLFRRAQFTGWRLGALSAALLGFISLVVNIVAIGWLVNHTIFTEGLAELYRDDCNKIEKTNTYIHLVINILSTLLLGGSNYCMQCLVAPRREAVAKAHRRLAWLDIGISSWRNLRATSAGTRIVWFTLVLSSMPLHLMYNSAFYASAATHSYVVRIVTTDFISNLNFQNLSESDLWAHDIQQWQTLSNAECIRAYALDLIEERSNVVIMTTNNTVGSMPFYYKREFGNEVNFTAQQYRPYSWICSDPEAVTKYRLNETFPKDSLSSVNEVCYKWVSKVEAQPDVWAPMGFQAEHCLSQNVTRSCGLNANLPIVIIVIVCNTIKCLVMLYVAFFLPKNPLIVVGDAIQSFLDSPDRVTKRTGLISRSEISSLNSRDLQSRLHTVTPKDVGGEGRNHQRKYPRRFAASSWKRWFATMVFFFLSVLLVVEFLLYGVKTQLQGSSSMGYFWNLGFGSVNGRALISGRGWLAIEAGDEALMSRILSLILLANLPQLIMSILYFYLNNLVTSMCFATEWAGYATSRKFLRVSTPVPKSGQRSTYFLTIPYRYGIPMLVISAAIHWLLSQSVFLAVISEYDENGVLTSKARITTCGYSPIALVFTSIAGFLLLVAIIGMGFPRLKADIPLAGSCSLAISAACHPPRHEEQVALKSVLWGAIPGTADDDGAMHCAFSSESVEVLVAGRKYT